MFGYIKPQKDDMTPEAWQDYRSAYCGLCRSLKAEFGQAPRLFITYEVVCLLSLLYALQPDERFGGWEMKRCLAHPIKAHAETKVSETSRFGAYLTMLLVEGNLVDGAQDGQKKRGHHLLPLLQRKFTKARQQFPELAYLISNAMMAQTEMERINDPTKPGTVELAHQPFSHLMGEIFYIGGKISGNADASVLAALRLLGRDVGTFIYLLDAIDDWTKDKHNGSWNPFAFCQSRSEAIANAEPRFVALEASLDRTAALMPYSCAGELMQAIFMRTIPRVRQMVVEGKKPKMFTMRRKNHA